MNAQSEIKTSNAELALKLAAEGVPVFPCRETGKKTKSPYNHGGHKNASTDAAAVSAWWQKWPNALVAILTGKASGLSVIDGDVCKEPGELLGELLGEAEIADLGLRLPGAVEVGTPSGGIHLYYKHVEGVKISAKQVADHVDERGEGGYVLAPGNVLPDGRQYSCIGRTLFEAIKANDLPAYPLEAAEAAKAARKAAQKAEKAAQKAAQKAEESAPGARLFQLDTGTHGASGAYTELTPEEELEVLRKALAEAPNTLTREEWVALAASLKAGYGDALKSDFKDFSRGYKGPGNPCDEKTAQDLWDSVRDLQIDSIRPAKSLLTAALGEPRWKALKAEVRHRHRVKQAEARGAEIPDGMPFNFELRRDGIYRLERKKVQKGKNGQEGEDGQEGELEATWICSPLWVTALFRDGVSQGWGREVNFYDPDGNLQEMFISDAELAGDGLELRRRLLSRGLQIEPSTKAYYALNRLLVKWEPEKRLRTTNRLGWIGEDCRSFVFGDGSVLSADGNGLDAEKVVHHSADGDAATAAAEMKVKGTLEGWRDGVAALCAGNQILVSSLSLSFCGPLLELLGLDGFGLHLRGESSRGKTSALLVAASVWGSPDFKQPWRATANGLEGVAMSCNSTLLALDEMGEIEAREAGKAAYMLANGTGKSRADRSGRARPPARWKVPVLSTGEISLADKMAEDNKRVKAGQEVRLLDIPADTRTHGVFDNLHGHKDGAAFSDALRRATAKHYGHAGRAFVKEILKDPEGVREEVRQHIADFKEAAGKLSDLGNDGQVKRAVERFALIAAAGELATRFGITGWKTGDATLAVLTVLVLWLNGRGGTGASEKRDAILRTRDYVIENEIEFQHFTPGPCSSSEGDKYREIDASHPIPRRAGWRDANFFYFAPATWEKIHKGADLQRAARYLEEENLLGKADGKNKRTRLPSAVKGRPRAYAVKAEIIGWGDE